MSLVRFSAKNHPQQVSKRGRDDSIDDRRTPAVLWAAIDAEFRFTLDAAASSENAKCAAYFTAEEDGLAHPWSGHRVWCNPPYSSIGPWVEKAWQEMRTGCELVVMLLPANRTEQRWWQEHVEPYRDTAALSVRFLAGRIRFDRPGWEKPAKGDRPPFGLCLLIWRQAHAA